MPSKIFPMRRRFLMAGVALLICAALPADLSSGGSREADDPWTPAQILKPDDLVRVMSGPRDQRPVVIHVGFGNLFRAGHIPGSRHAGPAGTREGIDRLKKALVPLRRDAEVVLYCGCCPMKDCPNIRPAFTLSQEMRFTRVRILDIPRSLEKDWIDKGSPLEKGPD